MAAAHGVLPRLTRIGTVDANPDNGTHIEGGMAAVRTKTGALLVRCTDEEAERIRQAAKTERRTLSSFILNAVNNRIEAREKLQRETDSPQNSLLPLNF